MGWFWNSTGSDKEDAVSSLDPRLKDFLDRETSQQQRHQSSSSTSPPPPSSSSISPSFAERLGLRSVSPPPSSSAPSPAEAAPPAVPPQSLYQDGRYSHLWSTYTPPSTTLASTSSQSQLESVLTSYNSRRGEVSRAALENCVEEHLAENECLGSGPFARKLRGCREEARRFGRCYELQARLLRAMGYMHPDAAPEHESMRLRADDIWTEVCRREDALSLARREGREEPVFPALELPRGRWVKIDDDGGDEEMLLARFGEEKRGELVKRIEKMSGTDRVLELRLELAEMEAHRAYGEKVGRYIQAEQEERRERKEKGQSTIGDWLKSLGGWSQ